MPEDKLRGILEELVEKCNTKCAGGDCYNCGQKPINIDNALRQIGELNKWTTGEPKEAMWCLVTYLTNDNPPNLGAEEKEGRGGGRDDKRN